MGIHGLTKLLADNAPGCIRSQKFENYFGRKVAVDASMHIYQFMIVVGRTGDQMLTDEAGQVTSHLQGMFFRTSKMLETGIKPVYVFDGKPPQLKKDQLEQRLSRREEAEDGLAAAKEAGDQEAIEKYSKRSVRVTKEHNEECKKLLRLMGVPVIDAPSEAEAQCAAMAKAGLVYGVATEDMDCLTFGSPRLIRHLMASSQQQQNINEFDREKALQELGLTEEQFVDLCILCGCDYCNNIRGIGPVKSLQLIQKHGSLEKVLEALDPARYPLPESYPYKESREFFLNPDVLKAEDIPPLKWSAPDEEGLVQFLVGEKNFSEDRVRSAVKRILNSKGKGSQGRMENFFGPSVVKPSENNKRKEVPGKAGGAVNKKGKAGPVGKAGPLGKKK